MATETQLPDVAPITAQGNDLMTRVRDLAITDNDRYARAGELLLAIAQLRKGITQLFAEPKAKAHAAHKAITELERKLLHTPDAADGLLKRAMGDYLRAEEVQRKEAEAAAAAALRKQEEDRRLAEAQRLDQAGHQAEAEQLMETPVIVPVVELAPPKVDGVWATKRWTYRVIDPLKVSRTFLMLDEKKIGAQVRSLGPDAAGIVGGIEVTQEFGLSARVTGSAA